MARIVAYATPSRLYRYRAMPDDKVDRELKAIEGGHIFCPNFREMNDPMEGTHRVGALLKESAEFRTTAAAVQDEIDTLGIASFSEALDQEPMWAHYAGQFDGICIQYSVKRLLQSLPDDHELIRMAYSEAPPTLLKNEDPTDHRARLVLSTKSLRWASEREWRLVRPARGEADYGRTDVVTGVYLGSRVGSAVRQEVVRRLHHIRIPAYDMRVEAYALTFVRIARPRPSRRK